MMVFAIMLILLLYSVQNVTFKEGSASAESMALQINLEEKNLANAISNAISQVYSQGPGAKTTAYVKLTYLRDTKTIEKTLQITDPIVFITYGPNPDYLVDPTKTGNGTYVLIAPNGSTFNASFYGGNKNVFWSGSLYSKQLCNVSSAWPAGSDITITSSTSNPFGSSTVYGLLIPPSSLPATMTIVVEWNPAKPDSWYFNSTSGELRININPGG